MSLPKYSNYKNSGVDWLGKVPAHWNLTRLKDIAQVINGYPFDSKLFDSNGAYPLIRIRDLNASETATRYSGDFTPSAAVTSKDVLIGMDGDFNVGRWMGTEYALLNQRMCCIRVQSSALSTFLCHALPIPLKAINDITYSTTVKHLSSLDVEKIRFALPDNEELVAIATFLDLETTKVDALIAEQEKLIALLAEKRQATISHAVTKGLDPEASMKDSGVAWLGEVPAHWEVKRFQDVCSSISTGPFGTALGADDYVTNGVPVVNPSHIVDNQIIPDVEVTVSSSTAERLAYWALRTADIVVARRGELGRAAVVESGSDGWICGTGSLRVTPRGGQATAGFLHAVLQSRFAREWLNQSSVGSTMANLNEGILGRLPIVIPPQTSEQLAVVGELNRRLADIAKAEAVAEQCVTLLQERRSALIAAAVTGQIDVRGVLAQEGEAAELAA